MRSEAVAQQEGELLAPRFRDGAAVRKIFILGDSIGEDLAVALSRHGALFPQYEFKYLKFAMECMRGFEVVDGRPRLAGPDACEGKLSSLLASELLTSSDLCWRL